MKTFILFLCIIVINTHSAEIPDSKPPRPWFEKIQVGQNLFNRWIADPSVPSEGVPPEPSTNFYGIALDVFICYVSFSNKSQDDVAIPGNWLKNFRFVIKGQGYEEVITKMKVFPNPGVADDSNPVNVIRSATESFILPKQDGDSFCILFYINDKLPRLNGTYTLSLFLDDRDSNFHELFRNEISIYPATTDFEEDIVVSNKAVVAWAEGQYSEVIQLITNLKKNNRILTFDLYKIYIRALVQERKYDEALQEIDILSKQCSLVNTCSGWILPEWTKTILTLKKNKEIQR